MASFEFCVPRGLGYSQTIIEDVKHLLHYFMTSQRSLGLQRTLTFVYALRSTGVQLILDLPLNNQLTSSYLLVELVPPTFFAKQRKLVI